MYLTQIEQQLQQVEQLLMHALPTNEKDALNQYLQQIQQDIEHQKSQLYSFL